MGMLIVLLLGFHVMPANAATSGGFATSVGFRQLGNGEIVADLSGFATPCETPRFLISEFFGGGSPNSYQLRLRFDYPDPANCGAGLPATTWVSTLSLGVLPDGDYWVGQLHLYSFPLLPAGYLGSFSVRQGVLVIYENVPVPTGANYSLWLLGVLLGTLALLRLSKSAIADRHFKR